MKGMRIEVREKIARLVKAEVKAQEKRGERVKMGPSFQTLGPSPRSV